MNVNIVHMIPARDYSAVFDATILACWFLKPGQHLNEALMIYVHRSQMHECEAEIVVGEDDETHTMFFRLNDDPDPPAKNLLNPEARRLLLQPDTRLYRLGGSTLSSLVRAEVVEPAFIVDGPVQWKAIRAHHNPDVHQWCIDHFKDDPFWTIWTEYDENDKALACIAAKDEDKLMMAKLRWQ